MDVDIKKTLDFSFLFHISCLFFVFFLSLHARSIEAVLYSRYLRLVSLNYIGKKEKMRYLSKIHELTKQISKLTELRESKKTGE